MNFYLHLKGKKSKCRSFCCERFLLTPASKTPLVIKTLASAAWITKPGKTGTAGINVNLKTYFRLHPFGTHSPCNASLSFQEEDGSSAYLYSCPFPSSLLIFFGLFRRQTSRIVIFFAGQSYRLYEVPGGTMDTDVKLQLKVGGKFTYFSVILPVITIKSSKKKKISSLFRYIQRHMLQLIMLPN